MMYSLQAGPPYKRLQLTAELLWARFARFMSVGCNCTLRVRCRTIEAYESSHFR